MAELHMNETIVDIKIMGVGGAGGNAINDMIASGISGVEFIAANTDAQDLIKSKAHHKIQLGEKLTKGLGAGAMPSIGRQAAEEDKEKIKELLSGTDMLFITAGMGGGTGTGAAPVIAKIAKEMGILTMGVITRPFKFEGKKREINAETGIEELKDNVDTLVIIPNEKLFELPNKKITFKNAFEEANSVLKIGIKGVSELITKQGVINLDFADLKTTVKDSGMAMLGFGFADGEDRAERAAKQAISSPFLERTIQGAKRILLNVTSGEDLGLSEVSMIAQMVSDATGEEAPEIIFGNIMEPDMENMVQVTIIATDFSDCNGCKSDNEEEVVVKSRKGTLDTIKKSDSYDPFEFDIPSFIRKKK